MRKSFFFLAAGAFLSMVRLSAAEERSPIYPFDVTTGSETASIEGPMNAAIVAKLEKPVSDSAEFLLDIEPEMVIVNVFPTDAKGTPAKDASAKTKIIVVQKGDRFSLDNTMDNKPVAPGTYVMNIVVSSRGTARVLFEITAAPAVVADIQATPEAAVAAIFDRAKSGDLKDLKQLLPPGKIADGDVKNLCAIGEATKEDQNEFREFFKKGKVVGKATIKENKATVDFLFGKDGKREETMNLIRIDGRWYLESF